MQAPTVLKTNERALNEYLTKQANKARPVFPKDVWLLILKKFITYPDLANLRLTSRYLNAVLTLVWDIQQLDFNTYLDVFNAHHTRAKRPTVVLKKNGFVYDSTDFTQRVSQVRYSNARLTPRGYGHSLVFYQSSNKVIIKMVGYGSNQFGQLAQPDVDATGLTEQQYRQAQQQHFIKRDNAVQLSLPIGLLMTKVTCGFHHTVILASGGRVFACGKNKDGQLGIGNSQNQYALQEVHFDEPIIDVAGGAEHTLFLGLSKTVYGAGRNSVGQLGVTQEEYHETPVKLITAPNVEKLFAGSENSFLIDQQGSVFGSGCNSDWQTKSGKFKSHNIMGFTEIENLPPMKAIYPTQYRSFGISKEHRLYGTGMFLVMGKKDWKAGWTELDNRYCQLRALQAKRKPIAAPIAGPRRFFNELTEALALSLSNYAISKKVRVATTFFKKFPTTQAAQRLSDQISNWKTGERSTLEMSDYLINILNNAAFDCTTSVNVASFILEVVQSSATLRFALSNLNEQGSDWAKDVSTIPATLLSLITRMRDQIKGGHTDKLLAEFGQMLCADPLLDQVAQPKVVTNGVEGTLPAPTM